MAAVILNLVLSFLEIAVLCWCQYQFMKWNFMTIHRKKFWYPVGFAFVGVVMYLLAALFGRLGYPWVPLAFLLLAFAALGFLLFHKNLKSILLDLAFQVLLMLAMETGIFLVNNLMLFTGIRDPLFLGNLTMVMKILCMFLITMAAVLWLRRHKTRVLQNRQLLALLILPLFCIFFFWSLITVSAVYIDLYGVVLITINILSLVALNFYFFYLIGYLFRSNELEQELAVHQAQSELQFRHYKAMEEKYQESRKILHDMKNHLQAVERLYQKENDALPQNATRYVNDLYHMLNVLGEQFYSSNRMLNIICNDKFSYARHKGISVTVQIGDVDFSDIRDLDMTTIFANLFDNAIEAAEACKKHPYIQVKIQTVREFRVIRIVNSMNPEAPDGRNRCTVSKISAAEKQRKQTSPASKEGHCGLGLPNVEQTLSRYHGTLHQETVGAEYRVSILLPAGSPVSHPPSPAAL